MSVEFEKPHQMSFVADEVLLVPQSGGPRQAVRLRIWQSPGMRAVVLASQVKDGPSPGLMSAKIANIAYRAFLFYPAAEPLFFESEDGDRPDADLYRILFGRFGLAQRAVLVEPKRTKINWTALRAMTGHNVVHSE